MTVVVSDHTVARDVGTGGRDLRHRTGTRSSCNITAADTVERASQHVSHNQERGRDPAKCRRPASSGCDVTN